jgi:hypothetical protein
MSPECMRPNLEETTVSTGIFTQRHGNTNVEHECERRRDLRERPARPKRRRHHAERDRHLGRHDAARPREHRAGRRREHEHRVQRDENGRPARHGPAHEADEERRERRAREQVEHRPGYDQAELLVRAHAGVGRGVLHRASARAVRGAVREVGRGVNYNISVGNRCGAYS